MKPSFRVYPGGEKAFLIERGVEEREKVGSIHLLSTLSTGLSTGIRDNFPLLTSTFTLYPQKILTPITTIFIYKYLSSPSERAGKKKPFRNLK